MKLNTVNVIEIINNSITQIKSFTDNEEGNKEAEAIFLQCLKENTEIELTEEVKTFLLDEGFYNDNYYQLCLTHSD